MSAINVDWLVVFGPLFGYCVCENGVEVRHVNGGNDKIAFGFGPVLKHACFFRVRTLQKYVLRLVVAQDRLHLCGCELPGPEAAGNELVGGGLELQNLCFTELLCIRTSHGIYYARRACLQVSDCRLHH